MANAYVSFMIKVASYRITIKVLTLYLAILLTVIIYIYSVGINYYVLLTNNHTIHVHWVYR